MMAKDAYEVDEVLYRILFLSPLPALLPRLRLLPAPAITSCLYCLMLSLMPRA